MTSTTFFFVFIPLLAIVLLAVNLIFAPHNPYQEKDSAFECGFHSFLGQNRTQFSISFFIYGLLFLLFDLEILLVFPFAISAYTNGIYGLIIMLVFFFALTLGFVFELGKNALKIDSRQMLTLNSKKVSVTGSISIFVRSMLNSLPNKNYTIKSSRPVTKTGILGSGHWSPALRVSLNSYLNNANRRVFSNTAFKHSDSDMMSRINKLLDESKAFDRSVQEQHSLIGKKNKLAVLKEQEGKKNTDFIDKFMPYLSQENREKAFSLFDGAQKVDKLIADKTSNLEFSKIEDCKKAVDLAEWTYKSNYKTLSQVAEMFKSTFEKGASNNTITQAEVDSFNILLRKRNIEKKEFLDFKNDHFKAIRTKLNGISKNSSDTTIPSAIEKKIPTMATETKNSMATETNFSSKVTETKASCWGDSPIKDEVPLSEEIVNIVKEILDLFT
jgi:NADH-ubiquinone oxidoreductase chain 3